MGHRTKSQHFVPRFVLEHFKDENGFVHTLDSKTGSWIQAKPENTATQTNLYSPITDDGRLDDFENFFSNTESQMSLIYPRLLEGEVFSGPERTILTNFIATQFLRSPAMLKSVAHFYGNSVDLIGKIAAENDPTIDEKMKTFLLQKDAYTINIDAKMGLNSLNLGPVISEVLFSYGWSVITTNGINFITGDSPVFKSPNPKYKRSPYGDGGLAGRGSRVTFPLSSNRLLFGELGMRDIQGLISVKVQDGKRFNRQRAIASNRFLYSNQQSVGIAKLGTKYFDEDQLLFTSSHDSNPIIIKRKLRH